MKDIPLHVHKTHFQLFHLKIESSLDAESTKKVSMKHAVLTGSPGVGKTTLVQKICKILKERGIPAAGFVTQEVREGGQRTGFQIITLDGKTGLLSSTKSTSRCRVGQYGVEVQEFEQIALPTLQEGVNQGILVIDEVGKMELFSDKFKAAVKDAFNASAVSILATIPIAKGRPIPFVEDIRNHPNAKLFQIDKTNRNSIIDEIVQVMVPSGT